MWNMLVCSVVVMVFRGFIYFVYYYLYLGYDFWSCLFCSGEFVVICDDRFFSFVLYTGFNDLTEGQRQKVLCTRGNFRIDGCWTIKEWLNILLKCWAVEVGAMNPVDYQSLCFCLKAPWSKYQVCLNNAGSILRGVFFIVRGEEKLKVRLKVLKLFPVKRVVS